MQLKTKKEKKKGQNVFDLPDRGFEPQIFSNFPPIIWIFIGDGIESRLSSYIFSTLPSFVGRIWKERQNFFWPSRAEIWTPDFQ